MFGIKRNRAINNAFQASGQLVNACQVFSDLPAGFWNDPYVLGFLTTVIAVFAEMTLGKKPTSEELGFIIIGTYERLNPLLAHRIAQHIVQLQAAKNEDYFHAVERAYKTVAVTYGHPDFDADPEVVAASALAKGMMGITPASNLHAAVGGVLQTMLFTDVVRRRLTRADSSSD